MNSFLTFWGFLMPLEIFLIKINIAVQGPRNIKNEFICIIVLDLFLEIWIKDRMLETNNQVIY